MFRADDVIELLPGLAGERPVFHSEADFQQALAWAIHVAQSRPSCAAGDSAGEGHAPRCTCH